MTIRGSTRLSIRGNSLENFRFLILDLRLYRILSKLFFSQSFIFMKNFKVFIIALCALFAFGCSTAVEQTNSPTATLKALNEAAKKKDTAGIKRQLSKGTLDLLEQSAKQQNRTVDELLRDDQGAPFEELPDMRNEQIEGDTATVEVKNRITDTYEKVPFVKENGEWKLALDKFMQDVMKRATEEMKKFPANSANTATPNESNTESGNSETNNK